MFKIIQTNLVIKCNLKKKKINFFSDLFSRAHLIYISVLLNEKKEEIALSEVRQHDSAYEFYQVEENN
jgi:hypothetical protein